jgi:uncharacterized protein (DUF58 family)
MPNTVFNTMFNAIAGKYRGRLRHWCFAVRAPEPGEVYLHQRRVYIFPSGAGFAFILMLAALLIGSINYTLSLGFGLTFLIAAVAVVDMHLTFRNLAHLHLLAGRVQPVFAGEEAQFELHLINRRQYDRFALWLHFIDIHVDRPEKGVDIAANATETMILSAPAPQRGWLAAPRVRLQTRFPLGLLRSWSYWQPDARALVYPYPEPQAPALPMTGRSHDDGKGHAGHENFAGIRTYQAGDPLRRLAWRQIAKVDPSIGGALVTKQFEGGASSTLCLDFSLLPPELDLELKLSRMTRWVIEAERQGLPYAFRLAGNAFDAALGEAHQAACLHALALHALPPERL